LGAAHDNRQQQQHRERRDVVVARRRRQGTLQVQAREFLSATHGMDRSIVVRDAAEKLADMLSASNAAADDAEQAIWNYMETLFGWRHALADTDVAGTA
jgi:hypothetical protein